MEPRARTRLGVWERRYLLKHYEDFDDATLSLASGVSEAVIAEFLKSQGATRSPGMLRRIERHSDPPPRVLTPGLVRARLTQLQSRRLRWLDAWLLLVMFVGSVLLYAATAARTVTGEDAGELLAAAHGFGVPHPPGYPLWLVLSWAADHWLSMGTVAFRVTLVSLVPAALANTLLLAVALKTIRSRLAAFAGASLFAVSLTHWTQAAIPEVYGLNTAFVAAQVLLLVRLAERPCAGRLLALAFVSGLSCTNHTSALPMAALVAVAALFIAPEMLRRPVAVTGAILLGLLPLALYFVLPWASARDPYVDWGNPETPQALMAHATRAQYSGLEADKQLADSLLDRAERLQLLGEWGSRQFGSRWALLLALVGFCALLPRQTGLTALLAVIAWLSTIVLIRYASFSFDREHVYANQIFWIPAWMALAWMAGGAFDLVLGLVARLRESLRVAGMGLVSAGVVALVVVPAVQHHEVADRSGTTYIQRYGRALLDVMEPGALYFPSSDHSTFALLYSQGVEGHRLDVVVADKYGQIERHVLEGVMDDGDRLVLTELSGKPQRAFEEATLIRKWPGPVYFANKRDMTDVPERQLEPVGPLFKVMTADEASAWWASGEDGSLAPGLRIWEDLQQLVDVSQVQRVDFTVQMVQSEVLYMKGFAQLRADRLDDAIASWSAMDADLAPLKQLFNNTGSALAEAGRTDEALRFYERALGEDPEYVLALRNKAVVHRTRGERQRAIETWQALVAIDGSQRDARLELATYLDQADRPLEALAQYEAIATLDPNDPVPWKRGGELLYRRGDRVKAEQAFERALRLDPQDESSATALARLRQGIDLMAAEESGVPPEFETVEPGAHDPRLGPPQLPGMPQDPARALFDSLSGGRLTDAGHGH